MRKIYLTISLMGMFSLFFFSTMISNTGGPSAGNAGSPLDNNCARSGCHSGTVNTGPGATSILSNVPGTGYVPGNTYTITVAIEATGISRFGFQALAAYDATSNSQVGAPTITNNNETQIRASFNGQYVTHRTAGTTGTDSKSWSFDWTAPAAGAGDVEIYAAFNAANNNGNTSGDNIYTDTLFLTEEPTSALEALRNRHASVYPTLFSDQLNISTDYVEKGEVSVEVSNLNGQKVHSLTELTGSAFATQLNSSDWPAGLYLVNVRTGKVSETFKVIRE